MRTIAAWTWHEDRLDAISVWNVKIIMSCMWFVQGSCFPQPSIKEKEGHALLFGIVKTCSLEWNAHEKRAQAARILTALLSKIRLRALELVILPQHKQHHVSSASWLTWDSGTCVDAGTRIQNYSKARSLAKWWFPSDFSLRTWKIAENPGLLRRIVFGTDRYPGCAIWRFFTLQNATLLWFLWSWGTYAYDCPPSPCCIPLTLTRLPASVNAPATCPANAQAPLRLDHGSTRAIFDCICSVYYDTVQRSKFMRVSWCINA
jgi:hypothetical protein